MSEQVARGFSTSKNEQRHGESGYSNRSKDRSSAKPITIGARFRMSVRGRGLAPRLTTVGGGRGGGGAGSARPVARASPKRKALLSVPAASIAAFGSCSTA